MTQRDQVLGLFDRFSVITHAKVVKELDFTSAQANKILDNMHVEGWLTRVGEGTPTSPYRYGKADRKQAGSIATLPVRIHALLSYDEVPRTVREISQDLQENKSAVGIALSRMMKSWMVEREGKGSRMHPFVYSARPKDEWRKRERSAP